MPRITQFKAKGRAKQRIEVYFDGALWATLDAETVVRQHLQRDEALDAARMTAILAMNEAILARKAAAGHAAHGGKTARELERNLKERGFSKQASAKALEVLRESGTVDDARTAERHVARKVRAGRTGPRKIAAELSARGVESTEARRALKEKTEGVDFKAECLKLARSQAGRYAPLADPKNRLKLSQFLARRGYEAEHVHAALRALSAHGLDDQGDAETDDN